MSSIDANALVFTEAAGLELGTVDVADPAVGEVRVRLRASGVCHSDLHVVTGDWKMPSPMVLGHEGAGVIESVGPGVDPSRIGERVILSWFAPCLRCEYCVSGRQWACRDTQANKCVMADGTTRLRQDGHAVHAYLNVGSFAEYAVVPETGAIAVPDELPFEVAALIGCGATTGIGAALHTAQVPPGSSAIVVGCGGVGLSVVMGLAVSGAYPIIAVDMSDEKLEAARAVGATHVVNAREHDPVDACIEETHGGANFVFEAAGRVDTAEQCVAMTRAAGTTVLVGMPTRGARLPLDVLDVALNGKTIIGCSYGSANASLTFPMLADLYLAGKLPLDELIGSRIGLADVSAAFDEMRQGKGLRAVVTY
ncbi:Zn-dependent alcohol dehydrogenase [Nocardioides sp. NPDC023903]|uniref:Zn-dependent alcohol dehydrogenase n=1 Tax=Nocardioides sp. NPDC023903 TaxID=3157195 RepID=UPI003401214C